MAKGLYANINARKKKVLVGQSLRVPLLTKHIKI